MEKILLMGINLGTRELLKEAKERGYYTIITDNRSASEIPLKGEADEYWDISTADTKELAKKCIERGVNIIACGVSEFNSDMTFRLCDETGLRKYCTNKSWEISRNKRLFKDVCKKCGVKVASDYDIEKLIDNKKVDCHLPVVVKPIDSTANKGVSFCYKSEDLRPAYEFAKKMTNRPKEIICEQMLEGREYAAAYALGEGEASLLNLFEMHNEDGTPHNIYSLDVSRTGLLKKYLDEVDGGVKSFFREGSFKDGIAWIEFMLNISDDCFYALECGYRFPASMIPYTFKSIRGFNAIGWYIDGFKGGNLRKDLPPPQTKEFERYGVSYLLWSDIGGTIEKIEGVEQIMDDDRIDVVDFIRTPGSEVSPNSIMGEVLFTADDKEEIKDIIEYINNRISVINKSGENMLIRFTSFEKIV